MDAGHEHGVDAVAAGNVDLLAFLAVGLLAGAHCLGMCGPLVTLYADRINERSAGRRDDSLTLYEVRQHALFNVGRATSYTLIGGLFGLLGAVFFGTVDAVALVGDSVRGIVGLLVGLFIIAAGVGYLTGGTGTLDPSGVPFVSSLFQRVSSVATTHLDRLATTPRIVGLGGVHGLLPCPIIYPAYLYAFAVGSPIRGALSLAVLGLGTIPTLFLYGTVLQSASPGTRARLHRALGVAFIGLGYIPLAHGLMLFGVHLPHPPLPHYQPL